MLVKYRPMENWLSPFESFWRSAYGNEECYLSPLTDILERKDEYVLYAEMPGVSKDDFKVELDNNLLTISGKKNIHEKREDEQFYRAERQCGDYKRSFRIGEEIDKDKISAKYENGVLEIVLPKAEMAKPKQVEIQIK